MLVEDDLAVGDTGWRYLNHGLEVHSNGNDKKSGSEMTAKLTLKQVFKRGVSYEERKIKLCLHSHTFDNCSDRCLADNGGRVLFSQFRLWQ